MNKPTKFGKYFLLERVNIGGMAEVFKAKSFGVEGFEKLVAIKRILSNIAEDEDFITMFIDEAKISVQLNHANIAQIYDLGKIEESFFIALEYVSGKDLRTIWERHKKHKLLLPLPLSVYTMIRVCEGLDYAHRKKDPGGRDLNIVHRDVSPQNILVSYEGEVKIIDFGIAKAANKASKTQAGILKGKFGYMSPEQVRGLPLDRRSDIFSAGIILYELLTGERLFTGESDFAILEKVRSVEILPPTTYNRNIPEMLEKISLKALSKDPDDRFQSAYDMQEELQRFLIQNKLNFARKDLAAYMKRAFKGDIEREMARQAEYQKILLPTDELPMGNMPTTELPAMTRGKDDSPRPAEEQSLEELLEDQQTIQPVPDPPPPPIDSNAIASIAEEEDEDIETVIFEKGKGTVQDIPTNPLVSKPPPLPPVTKPRLELGLTPKPNSFLKDEDFLPTGSTDVDNKLSDHTPADLTPASPTPAENTDPTAAEVQKLVPSLEPFKTEEEETVYSERSPFQKRSRLNLIVILLAVGAVAVVAAAVVKYFQQQKSASTSVPVAIQLTPADAEIWIDGKPIDSALVGSLDLVPGSHTFEARKPSFQPYKNVIEITPGTGQAVTIKLAYVPASLELEVEPGSSIIKWNDKPGPGSSPVEINSIEPNVEQVFSFELAGYEPKTMRWIFAPGEKRKEKVTLTELFFNLEINSEPSGARVLLDGNSKGSTPITVRNLGAARQYQLALKHPRFEEWSTTVRYNGVLLEKVNKRLESLSSGSTASDKTDHTTKIKENKNEPKKTVSTGGGKRIKTPTEPTKAASTGKLNLNSNPWGNVWIDGKDIGVTTPLLNYELAAGKHSVTIHFANGQSQSADVEIPAGGSVTKIIKGNQ